MKHCLLIGCLLLALGGSLRADAIDDQYVRIYNLIQQADALSARDQGQAASELYAEAQTGLKRLQTTYPNWNEKVIAFRLRYVTEKLASLPALPAKEEPAPAPAAPAVASRPGLPPPKPNTLGLLQESLRRLQTENSTLQAKLQEALSARPAAVDPQELAKSEEKVKTLQKENELLKVSLAQEQAKAGKADPAAMEQIQKALADSTQKLNEQVQLIATLRLENEALQVRLKTGHDDAVKTATESLRSENDSLRKQMASLPKVDPALSTSQALQQLQQAKSELLVKQTRIDTLVAEKTGLESRLKSLASASSTMAPDEIILAQNRELTAKVAKLERDLAESKAAQQKVPAQAELATRQQRIEQLEKEKNELERKLALAAAPGAVMVPAQNKELQNRLTALERELVESRSLIIEASEAMDKLRAEKAVLVNRLAQPALQSAMAKPAEIPAAPTERRPVENDSVVKNLRARLEVFEARQVPYTTEELALFKQPQQVSSPKAPGPEKKPLQALPSGASRLVAQAQQSFAARKYDEAEEIYQRVLKMDEKNVYTLSNLAAIQSEQNRLDEAEANLRRALSELPEDAYSLSLMGVIKFRQAKYEEALDFLSRAAQADPNNAETQNYLGITLSQKGQRAPAETALRRAIQISPGYGSAHHNLAVVYATQQPPAVELASWHYQKALDAGHAKNAELEKIIAQARATALK